MAGIWQQRKIKELSAAILPNSSFILMCLVPDGACLYISSFHQSAPSNRQHFQHTGGGEALARIQLVIQGFKKEGPLLETLVFAPLAE